MNGDRRPTRATGAKVATWVGADAAEVAVEGARRFALAAECAIFERGRFFVALAGGSTPRAMYQRLAEPPYLDGIDWSHVEIFWGDERCVPPTHADSNFAMAYEALLSKVPIGREHIHRIEGERDPAQAARDYEAMVREVTGVAEGWPRLDLVLLGMGADGHTASLFPGTKALTERTRLVVENWVEKFNAFRVTMTFSLINAAREVVLTVAGPEKTPVLRAIGAGQRNPALHPVVQVRPLDGELSWLLDRAAAG